MVHATDNVKVKRVHVAVYDDTMTQIERGEAADNGEGIYWIYPAFVLLERITGCKIETSAYDIAGNVTVKVV